MRQFGEMGVVAVRKKIQGKMESKGAICMFVGYAEDHSGDTYIMLNMITKKIILSRDVRWLNKIYGKWAKENSSQIDPEDIIPDEPKSENIEKIDEDKSETGREETTKPTLEVETASESVSHDETTEGNNEESKQETTP